MTSSWHNFFFVSFDPGGFISIDKPPVSMWIEAANVRLLGLNSWGLLLPGALAGAATVALLWCLVSRRFGPLAGTLAGAVLALSPVNVAVNRLNLPDPFMILFLVAAAWAVLRSLDDDRRGVWFVVLAGVLVGLAFNTKMLAAAIPVPALGLALLLGTLGGWARRLGRTALFGVVSLAASLPWILVVDAVGRSSRPYVGGSTNDTVWNLVFGYNGLSRVDGGQGGGPGGAFSGGVGSVIAGTPGKWRLFGAALGPQIAWLLPLAVVGGLATAWFIRVDRPRLASVVLWLGWLVLFGVVFSEAKGTFHAYYTSAMGPAVAALVGIGGAAAVRLVRRNRAWWAVVALGVVVTVWVQSTIVGREPSFHSWTRAAVVVLLLATVIAALCAVGLAGSGRRIAAGVSGGFLAAALLVSPATWTASEMWNAPLNATLPQAGPRVGMSGSTFGSAAFHGDASLASFLRRQRGGAVWDVVVANAQTASGLEAEDGLSVMALGGFMGTDAATTVPAFAADVAAGRVRYVLADSSALDGTGGFGGGGFGGRFGGGGGFGGGRFGGSGGSGSSVIDAARRVCTPVTTWSTGGALPQAFSGSLYDCAGKADALGSTGS
jgi:4-amino-4-deoxy-L-arabinose transferase-like glycosyltransferase